MAADSLGVLDALRGAPEQLAAAHESTRLTCDVRGLPGPDDFDNIVIMGMGGSGIVGDIVQAVGTGSLPLPVTVLKYYRTPAFVGPRTLAFAISYSGETEETLEMAHGALDAGATLVTLASGGALAELGQDRGALHVPCAPGLPSTRFALGTLVAPLFVLLFKLRLLPEAHAVAVKAQEQLKRRCAQCVPEIDAPKNPARELARKIGRTIPLVHGAGGLGAVAAMRWKQSINETAKAPAFWNVYPELDHNEICGWAQHGDVTRQVFTLIQLRHGLEHQQLEARVRITIDMLQEAFVQVLSFEAQGEGRLAQVLDLIYVGDWVAAYLALDHDVDPGPVDAINELKTALAKHT
jgi:glucose/mannose-6-phosphate isomerase